MSRRWYQTLDIDGAVFEDVKRKDSKFWNEGKWDNFIEPLLPEERQTFIEIGCNAGLFLKMAKDVGFRDVIGIEGNYQIFKQAKQFKESIGGEYKIEHKVVGDFSMDQFPLPDVVLISNMHYYLPVGVFSRLVDEIRNRCLYCIVVSAKAKRRKGNALYDLGSVMGYFRDWEMEKIVKIDTEGDCCPREQMYGVRFKSNVTAIGVDDVYDKWWEASKKIGHKSHELAPSMRSFFELVLSGAEFEYEDTDFYGYWRKREPKRTPRWTWEHLAYKASLAKGIQKDGIRDLVYITKNGKLLDGIHRLTLGKLLGYTHLIGKVI